MEMMYYETEMQSLCGLIARLSLLCYTQSKTFPENR